MAQLFDYQSLIISLNAFYRHFNIKLNQLPIFLAQTLWVGKAGETVCL